MRKILIFLVFIIILVVIAMPLRYKPQVFPIEGSSLNYRIIGFSFPQKLWEHNYTIEIAKGHYNSEDSFRKNIILSPGCTINKIIAEVPAFGCNYTWRIVYGAKNKSGFYHFSTILNSRVDIAKTRLNILQPAEAYKDAYIAVDGTGVIYDMAGNPVWCIPDSTGHGGNVTEMKFTPRGTITYMMEQAGYEINYDGKILWQTPAHDTVCGSAGADYYHHEFTRLSNGHYMILGTEYVWYKKITAKDTGYWVIDSSRHDKFTEAGAVKNRGKFGVIIEFDERGNVVWSWKSSKYLLATNADDQWAGDSSLRHDPHENSFYFDEQNKVIYLSYRNLSAIIKIEYPGGKVLNVYRGVMPSKDKALFCNQHSIMHSKEGYIYLFNNNTCAGVNALPSIVIMREPVSGKDSLEKIWEYTCAADGYTGGFFPYGGNAIELPGQTMFICMGSDYPRLLIVDREKKALWSALPEKYDTVEKKWMVTKKIYRGNIISRKDLERLVWHVEKI